MWGNSALEWFGEGSAYASAGLLLLMTAAISVVYQRGEAGGARREA